MLSTRATTLRALQPRLAPVRAHLPSHYTRPAACCHALPSRRDVLSLLATIPAITLAAPTPAFAASEAVIPSITSSPRGYLDVIVTFVPPAQQQLRELLERGEFAQAAQAVTPRAPTQFQAAGEAIALGFDDVWNSAAGLVASLQPLDQQKTATVKAAYDNFVSKNSEFRQLCLDAGSSAGEQAVEARQDALDAMFEALDGLVDTANTILTQPTARVDTA